MTHIVCIGDLMVDVVAQLPGPLVRGSDRPAPISLHGGGAAANVAVWAAEQGATATFVGRIGDDALGLRAVDELTAAGVLPLVEIDPQLSTGVCIVLVDDDGERTMVPWLGANGRAGDAALLPADADWLYLSGYTLFDPRSRPFGMESLDLARARGWRLGVDAASAAPLAGVGAAQFLDWVGPGVVLFANIAEAQVLTGLPEAVRAARTLGLRCGEAVVKCGAEGALWSDGANVRRVPAAEVDVRDSTGAGDAFAAAYLTCPGTVDERLAAAARLAARAVARVGARPEPR